ncbi:STAS domain-containing protein [Pseudomonas sp. dw_358]|uniref:STAS domain-containing protein n=1 Tax=Pseudomonas sp. dw_358 TaxID=2720083 RepID=UPI001BD2FD8B|nr:STAS domain-containing protein [Pseudomonas sp. dw_358]
MSATSTLSEDGQTLTIKVAGRFDFSAHQDFRTAYEKINESPKHFVVDLKETTYLDSSALGMLLLLRDHAGGDNADVRLTHVSADVKKILAISNFEKLFKVES